MNINRRQVLITTYPGALQTLLTSRQFEMTHGNADIQALQIGQSEQGEDKRTLSITGGPLAEKVPA
jgi:hypothetical protein